MYFKVHLKFKNAEPLIEKFSQDLFERNELVRDFKEESHYSYHTTTTTTSNNHNYQETRRDYFYPTENNNQHQIFYNFFYYDTANKNLADINSIKIDNNDISSLNKTSIWNQMEPAEFGTKITYPMSFIDAVNKKHLDLETGMFKDPKSGSFSLRLVDALHANLLNPKSAFIYDHSTNRAYDLSEAVRQLLITVHNRVVVTPNNNLTISLADALKSGYLKIGQPARFNEGCSITSETQSMSVRSIKDPSTGEFLAPTEAIKRKLLDPYKGLFVHPISNERLPISDAIQKGNFI